MELGLLLAIMKFDLLISIFVPLYTVTFQCQDILKVVKLNMHETNNADNTVYDKVMYGQ